MSTVALAPSPSFRALETVAAWILGILWVLPLAYHFAVTIVAYVRAGSHILLCPDTLPRAMVDAVHRLKPSVLYAAPLHFERMANLATKAGVEGRSHLTIHTPLIRLTKAQIVRRGVELGVDFGLTWSCYEPEADGRACGLCDSCQLRRKGFAEAGLADPVPAAH